MVGAVLPRDGAFGLHIVSDILTVMIDAGAFVREARRRRGYSQAALARAARTSQPAIARLEAGDVSPSVATLERTLGAIGFRLELGTKEADPGIDRTLIAQSLLLT